MHGLSAGVDVVEARIEGLRPLAKPFLEADSALPHTHVWVGTPATAAGEPRPDTPAAGPATVENGLIAGGLGLIIVHFPFMLGLSPPRHDQIIINKGVQLKQHKSVARATGDRAGS